MFAARTGQPMSADCRDRPLGQPVDELVDVGIARGVDVADRPLPANDALVQHGDAVGKLSMADVFLVAVYIVIVKGVGIGHVSTAWGLWLFTGCVLVSLWAGWATRRGLTGAAG